MRKIIHKDTYHKSELTTFLNDFGTHALM